jgi:hypothetical protein
MSDRSNDDIADALRGLASGEHAEGEPRNAEDTAHGTAHGAVPDAVPSVPPATPMPMNPLRPPAVPQPAPRAVPQPAPSRTVRPVQPVPSATALARPATPPSPTVARPVVARALAPTGPAAPVPVAPAPSQQFTITDSATAEDDAAIMPAPSVEYLAHVAHPAPRPPSRSVERALRLRLTLIPVLLTSGVLMLVAAVLKYVVNADAPLATMPTWMSVVLGVAGAALLGVAGLNISQTKARANA